MPNSTDADTSVTGAVLMGLLAARNAGMEVADEMIDTALEYMRRWAPGFGPAADPEILDHLTGLARRFPGE